MIKIDMDMPRNCLDCRFCYIDWTSDDKPDSSAFCCAAEKRIAYACDGKDIVVCTAILEKQDWCPLIDCEDDLKQARQFANPVHQCRIGGGWGRMVVGFVIIATTVINVKRRGNLPKQENQ